MITCVGVVIAMTQKAGGAGEIWSQKYTVSGSTRSWLILSSLSSITGGWATMATNIPDFTRYLKKSRGVYWQVAFLPLIQLMLGLFGIISTSASMVVYGQYIWGKSSAPQMLLSGDAQPARLREFKLTLLPFYRPA